MEGSPVKQRKGYSKEELNGIKRRAAVWIVMAVVAFSSLLLIRRILLDNARRMGNEMAHSYSAEGERNIIAYETLMQVTTQYIDQQLTSSSAPMVWIQKYLESVGTTLGANIIDPYAVIDGKIVAANPWEGDETYNARETDWYKNAIAAQGRIIYTDGYQDVITGRTVVTIAQAGKVPETVVAFDIFHNQLGMEGAEDSLPEGSSYFLCDSSGTLLYAKTDWAEGDDQIQAYLDALHEKIQHEEADRSGDYIYEVNREKCASYYDVADNGWISVVAIPYDSLLQGVHNLSLWYAGILAVFFITMVVMSVRENRLMKISESWCPSGPGITAGTLNGVLTTSTAGSMSACSLTNP